MPIARPAGVCRGVRYALGVFTGLVQAVGRVAGAEPSASGARLVIDPAGWAHAPALGDSISIDGCCLTLAAITPAGDWCFDAVAQTLSVTTLGSLRAGSRVNLEHACRADTLLGGHIVQGHVDGVAEVILARRDPADWRVRFRPPPELMECMSPKGSVAVSGVSLTLAAVGDDWFEVALIPTTLEKTNLDELGEGSRCNIETDIIARTVVQWLRRQRGSA